MTVHMGDVTKITTHYTEEWYLKILVSKDISRNEDIFDTRCLACEIYLEH